MSAEIDLKDLQAGDVFVRDENGNLFRIQPSFKVGEFQLHQMPAVVVEDVAESTDEEGLPAAVVEDVAESTEKPKSRAKKK